jgi:hypothetical protein
MSHHKKQFLGLTILVLGILSGCGSNNRSSGTQQPGLGQNPVNPANPYGNYMAPGTIVQNCQPNEIRLQGTCTFQTNLAQACRTRGGTFIGAVTKGSNGQNASSSDVGICRFERKLQLLQRTAATISFGASRHGCQQGGNSPFCFTATLRPQESLVVFGQIQKNRPGLEWQLELVQNGSYTMGTAQGGGIGSGNNGKSEDPCVSEADPRRKLDCQDDRARWERKGKVREQFILQGAPNLQPGPTAMNGNPNFAQFAQMQPQQLGTPSSYELRLLTMHSFQLWMGVSAISCEDGRNNYVSCPVSALANTLQ